jgi:hypothetical protein
MKIGLRVLNINLSYMKYGYKPLNTNFNADDIEYLGYVKYDYMGIKLPMYSLVTLKMSTKPYYIKGPCKRGTDLISIKPIIENILKKTLLMYHEKRIIQFINSAKLLTNKLHQLDALKWGIKIKTKIIEERDEKGPFTSLDDFKSRIGYNLEKLFIKSLLKEIIDQETDLIRNYLTA